LREGETSAVKKREPRGIGKEESTMAGDAFCCRYWGEQAALEEAENPL